MGLSIVFLFVGINVSFGTGVTPPSCHGRATLQHLRHVTRCHTTPTHILTRWTSPQRKKKSQMLSRNFRNLARMKAAAPASVRACLGRRPTRPEIQEPNPSARSWSLTFHGDCTGEFDCSSFAWPPPSWTLHDHHGSSKAAISRDVTQWVPVASPEPRRFFILFRIFLNAFSSNPLASCGYSTLRIPQNNIIKLIEDLNNPIHQG